MSVIQGHSGDVCNLSSGLCKYDLRKGDLVVIYSIGVLKYIVCLCRGCDGCCVFCLYCIVRCGAEGAREIEV